MTDLEKQRKNFLDKLGDSQLGIYLAHEGQASCDNVMQDHLTMKQYTEYRRLMETQQKQEQANIPKYPPFLDEITTEDQAKTFRKLVDESKWKILDSWMSQHNKYIMRYYEWKNRVLEKKTIEAYKGSSQSLNSVSSTKDLSSHLQDISLQSPLDTEPVAPEYKIAQDGSIKVLVTVKGDVSGHIIGPQGRTVKSIAKECGVAVNVVRAYGSTLVNITSRTKEQLIKAQLKLWSILSLAQAAEIRRHFDDGTLWQKMSDEEKAKFQCQYSVSASEGNGCLQLATYSEELFALVTKALTSRPATPESRWEKLLSERKPEPLKITIIIKTKKIIGYLIGKNGKTVEWVRDKFNVEMTVTETGDATLVRLTASDKTQLLEAELDIWRSLGKIQQFTEIVQDKGVVNAWNNVWQMEERVRFMNRSNTFVAKVTDMDCLLIRGFTNESVKEAAAKLKTLLENGKLPSEDDKTFENTGSIARKVP